MDPTRLFRRCVRQYHVSSRTFVFGPVCRSGPRLNKLHADKALQAERTWNTVQREIENYSLRRGAPPPLSIKYEGMLQDHM
jgi:hypothetical protein